MTLHDLARQYLKAHPDKSKRHLAAMLVREHPDKAKNLESARTAIRVVTGSSGDVNRKKISFFERNEYGKWVAANLNQDQRPWDEPYQIPGTFKQLNIIADLHSIHMDAKVMERFLLSTKDKTALLINGDLLDSESLSRHMKLHNLVEYEHELQMCHQLLKGLKEEFDHVYFKAGNHDYWLERYLLMNAREVFKLRGMQLEELLQLAGLGVHYIHQLRSMSFNDIDIIHGHEFNTAYGNGKYPAGGYVDKWQTFKGRYDVRILASHCHRQDYVVSKRSKDGKYGEGWVTPAFCRKGASYNPYAGWDNGWAVLHNEEGKVRVQIVTL